ncbi:hypothetical protein FNH22_28070 [Fulvivirga sp. M361]|uniref:hypothetical protein n=1 Tax=Fulvivirga sp. M361 TaxID=2594266 RepID=UPI00117AC301|nr:hypothetical protein [Fulvivirga sp. M361]TRX48895.1 hypothetical protein FNH22_28070 [Fulvivirga sp. M361]
MKILVKAIVCLIGFGFISSSAFSQRFDQGVGLRIGDAFGISYKIYGQRNTAFEFGIGTTSRNRHGAYYRDKFKNINDFDGLRYADHDVNYTLALQGRYLLHYAFPANVEGRLDWYWGVGAQMRLSGLEYSYFNESSIIGSDDKTNFDLGPEGILGVEYELQDYPVVSFAEVSLLAELVDQPFKMRIFGAIGVRYAF